jgi:hypothetical protein
MKVTAILPDELVDEVRRQSRGKNITQSLKTALTEWLHMRHIEHLNLSVHEEPLEFRSGFSAGQIRETNRRRDHR